MILPKQRGIYGANISSHRSMLAGGLGFQTWIDPDPTLPYKLRVDPTYDVSYQPGDGTESSLVEGQSAIVIGGFTDSTTTPVQQPLMEFPLGDLPEGAVIEGAHLELNFSGSVGSPRIEVTGFAGDGLASFSDATTAGTLLAITEPTSASSSGELPIDVNFVASLIGEASHLGIRMRSLDLPLYVSFTTLDAHSSLLPPRLVIDFTLPRLGGDFNSDGNITGDDFLAWQRGFGSTFTANDLNDWQTNYPANGTLSATSTAVPEASTLLLAAICLAGVMRRSEALNDPAERRGRHR